MNVNHNKLAGIGTGCRRWGSLSWSVSFERALAKELKVAARARFTACFRVNSHIEMPTQNEHGRGKYVSNRRVDWGSCVPDDLAASERCATTRTCRRRAEELLGWATRAKEGEV